MLAPGGPLAMIGAGWKPSWATLGEWGTDERLKRFYALMETGGKRRLMAGRRLDRARLPAFHPTGWYAFSDDSPVVATLKD
jgi:hypothetical protein